MEPMEPMEPMDARLAEYVERKADDIARLITDRVKLKLQVEEKLRVLAADQLRVTLHDETPIASLPLSTRLLRALEGAGVTTLGGLSNISEGDLGRWRQIGASSRDQLRKFLTLTGRALRPEWVDRRGPNPDSTAR